MYGEVYIDLVFLTNLIMDYLLLGMLGKLLHLRCSRIRLLMGAAVGGAGACLFLYLPMDRFFTNGILLNGFLGICMIRISYEIRQGGLLLKAMLVLYFTAFLCGGLWDVMSHNRAMSLKAFFLFTACTYGVLTCISTGRECFLARTRNLFPVTLTYQGRSCSLRGLYDTGNLLKDSITREPVSVVSMEAIQELFTDEIAMKLKYLLEKPGELEDTVIAQLKPHPLSFRTVGQDHGLIVAITLEKMSIHAPRKVIEISHPVLAVSLEPSTLGKDYQLILNSELMQ